MRHLPIVLSILLSTSVPAAAELRVLAATTDLGAVAKAVGGEHVEVEVVARPDRDPHSLQVRPSAMRAAARADFYLPSASRWISGPTTSCAAPAIAI